MPPAAATAQRHVLLTGGSSGIGLEAAKQLLEAGHRLTVLCRDGATGDRLRTELGAQVASPICDLADLTSVERCAAQLVEAAQPIDTLVLNAGLQYSGAKEPRWSAQGFELTIAVNHLAHQALLQRLLVLLEQGKAPRLVVTASEVHDPKSGGGKVGRPAGVGSLVGLRQGAGAAMLDGSAFDAEKAYKDSKLCNLLMAREAARRWQAAGSAVRGLAWSPGLVIPRSEGGFFRYSRVHNPAGQALFALVARDLLQLTESPQRAGALLAGLATTSPEHPEAFEYWSNRVLGPGRRRFERSKPSAEARSDALAQELWELSAQHASRAVAERGDTPAAPR
ncbi:SDR family NAD(P)-dependent oxidoreductase [Synechococcus sp. FGCU-3]|nr:SDR family NAD(P)-dependent oxidoreductase [Synechococcus sp. FGCU3]